jgi:endoglucanase
MHAPQGGYQSQGNGDALWNEVENQNRLKALWKAIATKYKNEPTIIGYGLVNEPVPISSLNQWQQLAQHITNSVRQVDTNHLVFVEKPIYIKNVPGENADLNFPIIADSKVVYEFHFYDPIQYTHQLFTWANLGEGGEYPDENIISYTNGNWYTATFNNPITPTGNTDWRYYEGVKYTITDPNIKLAVPALVAKGVAPGTIYFDNISIKEFDANGIETGTILSMNLNSLSGWGYWSQNNTGATSVNNQTGNGDNNSIAITGATDDCNVSNYDKIFIPKQGYSYQISGWMKGDQIPTSANCQLRIDFITTNNPILKRNKAYLLASLQKYIDWSNSKNVPIYMGEFGVGKHCFTSNKGGIQWVTDMLDICTNNNIYFTYHAYHEDSFGIYFGDGILPQDNNANQPLIDLFKLKLR